MTLVKICGLTRVEDVAAAVAYGADWLGFIHVPQTPRFVDVSRLRVLLAGVPAGIKRVIVVRDAAPEMLTALRDQLEFDDFQFHGKEPASLMAQHRGYPVIGVRGADFSRAPMKGRPFLLDTQVGNQDGGTGKTFDWNLLNRVSGHVLVAGGLTPHNVAALIRDHHPWGVDVSSGVEAKPGVKDHDTLKAFIETVRSAQ